MRCFGFVHDVQIFRNSADTSFAVVSVLTRWKVETTDLTRALIVILPPGNTEFMHGMACTCRYWPRTGSRQAGLSNHIQTIRASIGYDST